MMALAEQHGCLFKLDARFLCPQTTHLSPLASLSAGAIWRITAMPMKPQHIADDLELNCHTLHTWASDPGFRRRSNRPVCSSETPRRPVPDAEQRGPRFRQVPELYGWTAVHTIENRCKEHEAAQGTTSHVPRNLGGPPAPAERSCPNLL